MSLSLRTIAACLTAAGFLVVCSPSGHAGAALTSWSVPDGCTATPGAPTDVLGPGFLTCAVSFPAGTVTGAMGSGVTLSDGRSSARIWDNHIDVILPAGYSGTMRYPVLYLLHGDGDTYQSWESNTDLDSYVAENPSVCPFIVVMPDGGANANAGWYSNWYDGQWQYETYDTVLLPEYVNENFSTRPDDTGIAGLSMGGFGALSYAGRHPGMFKVAASFSGAVDMLYGAPASGVAFNALHDLYGTPTEAVWGNQVTQYSNWEAHNPTSLAPELAGTTILLASGTGTPGGAEGDALDPTGNFDPGDYVLENAIFQMNLSLVRALSLAGVPYTTDFYPGGYHGWPYWQADLHWALSLIEKVLGRPLPT